LAVDQFATGSISAQTFGRLSSDLGFGAAVLLDSRGRVLQVQPAKPALLGQVITGKYAHLASAVAGRAAVSNVVPSAARGLPVVAFAAPFPSPQGRRVFSGAFDVAHTPLGAYLSHMITTAGNRVYLVDANGQTIATSLSSPGATGSLKGFDPGLAAASVGRTLGSYKSTRGAQAFVAAPVVGTPWRIIVSVPERSLYSTVEGTSKTLAWVAVAALALAGLIAIGLAAKLLASYRRVTALNHQLDRVAHVDPLTEVQSRRAIEDTLRTVFAAEQRHRMGLSVLMADVDHFKRVNDTFGHQAGDRVLAQVAATLSRVLRSDDSIGRWGGEEFLVILPSTDAAGARLVAERMRAEIASSARNPGADTIPAVTVTIGVAEWTSGSVDELIRQADVALYAGKAAGRDNVQTFAASRASEAAPA